jgi:hypothetical protein
LLSSLTPSRYYWLAGQWPTIGFAPAVAEPDQQKLVLKPGQGELAVVVDAQRVLVQLLDRLDQRLRRVGLCPIAALARHIGVDHERAGDVAAVAGEQLESVIDGFSVAASMRGGDC